MPHQKVRIPLLPILGLLVLIWFIYGKELYITASSYFPPFRSVSWCEQPSSKGNSRNEAPSISIAGIDRIDWKLPVDGPIIILAHDDARIAIASFKFYVDVGGQITKYTVDDPEISYTGTLADTTFTFTPQTQFLDEYSHIFFARVRDCTGKPALSVRYTSTCDNYVCVFWTRPAYVLEYLVWYLAIFGSFIKKKPWASVYDSRTKEPIPRAVIRTYSDNALVHTDVSDVTGSFRANVPPGTYTLEANAGGYTFPSSLKPRKVDGTIGNLYYGEQLTMKVRGPIMVNIPLDPQKEKRASFRLRIVSELYTKISSMSTPLLAIGTILPIVLWGTDPEGLSIAGINTALLSIQWFMKQGNTLKWGKVVDEHNNPVPNITVNLINATYNQVVDSQISDSRGQYIFVVSGGSYRITISSDQYVIESDKSDLSITHEETVENIVISPKIVVRPFSA